MSKRKRTTKRKQVMRRRQTLKTAFAVFLVVIAVTLIFGMCHKDENDKDREVIGVWVSYGDFDDLGLYNKGETEFTENAGDFLDDARELGVNTVYFHVRAFRDAVYDSEYFPTATYLWDKGTDIGYDPLTIMVRLAHERDMELHAWMNPYRNRKFGDPILDPADKSTTEEILLCVNEVVDNYDVDGIHFDDYFYEEGRELSDTEKMKNVNSMIRKVYSAVHDAGRNLTFGISPAGNISYCESIGADVRSWLSEDGYVDYIIPQIYWTDEHTATWRDDMFTDTLDQWIAINDNGTELYIGLAAYKAGVGEEADPGWTSSKENLAEQVTQIREKDCDGFVFFSASDFYRGTAEEEFYHYRNLEF